MPRLPQVKPVRLIRALRRAGFYIDHITGSHHILYKDGQTVPISVPRHNRDLKVETLKSILKQARLTVTAVARVAMIGIFTGHGTGKTTAALGQALRAVGEGV